MDRLTDKPINRLMDRPVREVKGQRSQVVFFSNLPREEEKKKELLTIARRFGIVEKHLFLTDQVRFIGCIKSKCSSPGDRRLVNAPHMT